MALSPNYSWAEPDNSSLVKNGASDIRTLGNAIDTSVWNITKGQAGKNVLINGLMDIWQRSTSVTFTSIAYNAQDRWYNYAQTSSTFARESSIVPTGCTYSCKVTIGASASTFSSEQAIETLNAAPYAGQTMTFSGYFQSSATPTITFIVYWSTAVDNPVGGTWTTLSATSGGSGTAGASSFTRISGVYAIPSTAKSLKVLWYSSSIAAAGVLYWGGMQFEAGSVPTQVTRNGGTIQGELAACQRYYYRSGSVSGEGTLPTYARLGSGSASSTTVAEILVNFPTTMRIASSTLDYANIKLTDLVSEISSTAVALSTTTRNTATLNVTVASGLTQFRPYYIANNGALPYVGFSAEL